MWKINFHKHVKKQAKLYLCTFWNSCYGQQTGRRKILDRVVAGIFLIKFAVNFFMQAFLVFRSFPTIFGWQPWRIYYLSLHMLWFCRAFYARDIHMYVVFSAFSSGPISSICREIVCKYFFWYITVWDRRNSLLLHPWRRINYVFNCLADRMVWCRWNGWIKCSFVECLR
jgi:hypothetical protein